MNNQLVKKYLGHPPLGGKLIGESHGFQLFWRCRSPDETHPFRESFKLVSVLPRPRKANFWLAADRGQLESVGRDYPILATHFPDVLDWCEDSIQNWRNP